jgi:cytidylate kinase
MIITIDGPAGTGKSTVAQGVAKRLGFTYFDTGAMYRSLSWLVLKEGIDPSSESKVIELLPQFRYEIRATDTGGRRYFVQDVDITDEIRSQRISSVASQIGTFAKVREELVAIQRKFGTSIDAVFEGRDMGTVVFPDADLKIFLTADAKVRAERRHRELLHKFPDISTTLDEILKEIVERDKTDSSRAISPLKQASDAIFIDTSHLSAHQVIEKVVKLKPKRRFPKMKLSYKIVYTLARLFFKLCFRLRIYGLEHFPPGSAIIAANHSSFYDPPVLSISCPEEVHFLARGSLFESPLFGRLIRMLNSHSISRGTSDVQAFKTMLDLLSSGNKLILFPEGKRSIDGSLLPLERGLGFLVQKAHCRVIPAYIQGSFEAWPRGRKFPKLFGKMTVAFGRPIEWEENVNKKASQERIVARTEQAIHSLKAWVEAGAEGTPP